VCDTAAVSLTWWWLTPLALGAVLAAAAPLVTRRLKAATAALEQDRRAVELALRRTRRAWPENATGSREPAEAGSRPAPDTYLDIR
jgi:hypothetical protein